MPQTRFGEISYRALPESKKQIHSLMRNGMGLPGDQAQSLLFHERVTSLTGSQNCAGKNSYVAATLVALNPVR